MVSPWSGGSACAASRPGGRAPLRSAAGHPVAVSSRGHSPCGLSQGLETEEAEWCGVPWLRNTARIYNKAYSLSSSQRSQPKKVSLGPDASQAHLTCSPSPLTWAGCVPVAGWRLVFCRAGRGDTSGGRVAVSPTWTHLGDISRTRPWPWSRTQHLRGQFTHLGPLLGILHRHADTGPAGSIWSTQVWGGPDSDVWQVPGAPLGPWAHCVGFPGPHLKKGPPALLGHPQSQDDSDSQYGAKAWLQGQGLMLSQVTWAGPSPSLGCIVGQQRGLNETAPEKPSRSPSGPPLAERGRGRPVVGLSWTTCRAAACLLGPAVGSPEVVPGHTRRSRKASGLCEGAEMN